MKSQLFLLLSLITLASSVTACGIKPNNLEPPPGIEADKFPATYPDPITPRSYE